MTKFISSNESKVETKKKTVFTKMVTSKGILVATNAPHNYDNVMFLYHDNTYDSDMFLAWRNDNENDRIIYFGVKGDEFYD